MCLWLVVGDHCLLLTHKSPMHVGAGYVTVRGGPSSFCETARMLVPRQRQIHSGHVCNPVTGTWKSLIFSGAHPAVLNTSPRVIMQKTLCHIAVPKKISHYWVHWCFGLASHGSKLSTLEWGISNSLNSTRTERLSWRYFTLVWLLMCAFDSTGLSAGG